MSVKRWAMAALGAFGIIAMSDYLIHEIVLGEFYRTHAQWWRLPEEMQALSGFMIASQVALAVLLSLIYTKGYEPDRGRVAQGFRYGVLMGLLLTVPTGLMHFFVYPYPFSLVLSWLVGGLTEVTLAGIIIGFLYKTN